MIIRRFTPLACTLLLASCTIIPIVPPEEQNISSVPSSASGAINDIIQVPAEGADADAGTGSGIIDERLLPSGMTEVGAETAPVSLMLFTNAACGYCTEFHEDIFPRLLADYVRTGRVRVAVSPFLLRKYEDSADAALAQLCAARQGKGMAMHDLLFRERVGTPAYRAAIDILAIDQEAFTRCTADPASRMVIDARQAVAASLGITLIPSYVINGATFTGLPSYGDIRGQIEEALRASGRSR